MGEVVPLSAAGRDQDDPLRALVICKSALLSRARADDQFSDAEYRIYAAALDYTHRELDEYFGMLWPSVSKLARDAGGKGRRTVQRALTKFVTLEYLHLVSDRRGGRRKAPNGSAVATAFYALPGIRIDSCRHGHSAADAPVNSATDAPINSATEAPQSYREEPMEETSVSRARGAKVLDCKKGSDRCLRPIGNHHRTMFSSPSNSVSMPSRLLYSFAITGSPFRI